MTKRYYQVIDPTVKKAIVDILNAGTAAFKRANEWGASKGVGAAAMSHDGLFGGSLHGFAVNDHYRKELANLGTWVKPKAGYVWPRSQKGKPLSVEFQELCKEVYVNDRELSDVLGWNTLSYMFSGGVGFKASGDKSNMFFIMGESISELPHCKEVSNLEMIKLTSGE
tara:strand:- start:3617 stop:4120 length:504 start_codon:yes stop_codon:yes gene_type:complete